MDLVAGSATSRRSTRDARARERGDDRVDQGVGAGVARAAGLRVGTRSSPIGSGSRPASTEKSAATSATVRAIGPGLSWLALIGTTWVVLTAPTVGLSPTTPLSDAGHVDRAVGLGPDGERREPRGERGTRPRRRPAGRPVERPRVGDEPAGRRPAARRPGRADVGPLAEVGARDDDRRRRRAGARRAALATPGDRRVPSTRRTPPQAGRLDVVLDQRPARRATPRARRRRGAARRARARRRGRRGSARRPSAGPTAVAGASIAATRSSSPATSSSLVRSPAARALAAWAPERDARSALAGCGSLIGPIYGRPGGRRGYSPDEGAAAGAGAGGGVAAGAALGLADEAGVLADEAADRLSFL